MNHAEAKKILVASPPPPPVPVGAAIVEVAKAHGISPIKQFREIGALYFGATKLASNEYYAAGLFRKDLTKEQKKQFVGEKSNLDLNLRLSPRNIARISDFLGDKVLYASLLDRLGLPTPDIQAVASAHRGYGEIPTLRSAEAIETFLLETAKFPLFGKPTQGSKSVGSVRMISLDPETRMITLGNGAQVGVRTLCEEIFTDFARGFVFQSVVEQHKDMTAVAGEALGTVRVVTLATDQGVKVLYSLWKIPAPDAMSDNFWQKGSMLAELDATTGDVKQVRRGSGMNVEMLDVHPVSGAAFNAVQIPSWDKVIELATKAHSLSPENGILGWDIGVSQDGPVIVECNTNPFHSLYQIATGRGILNEEFASEFEPILKRNEAITAQQKAKEKAKKK